MLSGMELILTHEHADFDAIGAMVGLARLLPEAVPVLPQVVNGNVADFLTLYGRELGLRRREDLRRRRLSRVWLVDTDSAASVRGMQPDTPRVVIDHHARGAGDQGGQAKAPAEADPLGVGDPRVGAASTLIAERLAAAGLRPGAVEATLLLLGIHEDTGSLTYAGTTARDLRAAAWLLEAGADLAALPRFLRHQLSDAGRALYLDLVESAESLMVGGHPIVLACATAPGFADELSSLATRLAELLEPAATFVLVDLGGQVQMVARSRSPEVDVAAVAAALGGGGHARAAAGTIRSAGLPAVRERLLEALPAAVRSAARVADIMSRGQVRTLPADASIAEALAYARNFDHEGYPVLDGARVAGVVSRRDLDRALQHGLGKAPLAQLLAGPPVTIEPGASIETLQQRMTRHDLGQVPVVEDSRLIGIVTRTDLLRWWTRRLGRAAPDEVRVDLDGGLAPAALDAVRRVAAVAAARGERCYLVGGIPRDLLLGRPPGPDIDLVVEGDAVGLAQALVAAEGGRVRAHTRFGTAKWIGPALSVDLVGARAEYYRAPTALPTVESGTLRSDLRRRDFTINSLAIALEAEQFGQVIDLFNGLADLRAGLIRVLHPLSFVEDPTRILRAVRFENRLGFRLDPATAARIPEAVALLGQVSGARLRAELLQLFAEPDPPAALDRLEAMGALEAIQAGLRTGPRLARLWAELPGAWASWRSAVPAPDLPEHCPPEFALLLWLVEQGDQGPEAAARLDLPGGAQRLLEAAIELRSAPGCLGEARPSASALHHALARQPSGALLLAWLGAEDPTLRGNLLRYASGLAAFAPLIGGADLAELGLAPGPRYGEILRAVLDAQLEGRVTSREEALALAHRLAEGEGDAE